MCQISCLQTNVHKKSLSLPTILFADDLVMRADGRDASSELAEVVESQARIECK